LREKICPEPFLVIMKRFSELEPGESIEAVLDSWRCVLLLVEAMKSTKTGVADVEEKDDYYYVRVTKLR
jgi:TusA-related sulfurtransferase